MSRREYHLDYYWRNVEKRREQRAVNKRNKKHKDRQKLLNGWKL